MNISAINFTPRAFKCSFGSDIPVKRFLTPDEYMITNADGDKFIRSRKDPSNLNEIPLAMDEFVKSDKNGNRFIYSIKDVVKNEELATLLELPLANEDGSFNAYDKAKDSTKEILYTMLLSAEYDEVTELPAVFKSVAAVAYIRGENASEKTLKDVFGSVADLSGFKRGWN